MLLTNTLEVVCTVNPEDDDGVTKIVGSQFGLATDRRRMQNHSLKLHMSKTQTSTQATQEPVKRRLLDTFETKERGRPMDIVRLQVAHHNIVLVHEIWVVRVSHVEGIEFVAEKDISGAIQSHRTTLLVPVYDSPAPVVDRGYTED